MFNVVKVESVPLKFNFFLPTASRVYPPRIIGKAERVQLRGRIGLFIAAGVTVNSVDVTRDDAVANVRFQAANHEDIKTLDIDFRREGADWKACRYHVPRAI